MELELLGIYRHGLSVLFDLNVMIYLVLGVGVGIIVGCLPGLSATMGVAVCTPLTYGMGTEQAFALLLGVYCGAVYGGSVSAVLVNIPGTPAAIMTALDGHAMAMKGEAGRALGIATVSSFLGGLFSVVILSVVAPLLAEVALRFSAHEYFAVSVFGLSIVSYISPGSLVKGLVACCAGVLISTIGLDPMTAYPRFTFGRAELLSGIELIPVLVGLFGLSEILTRVEEAAQQAKVQVTQRIGRIFPSWKEVSRLAVTYLRGSCVGTLVGAMPATGATIAAILSYGIEKRFSRDASEFGKGCPAGIASCESANNASTGGAMIPMLTLGIPGDAVTAILIGALLLHGLRPGPLLFKDHPQVVGSIFVLMAAANFGLLVMGLFGARWFARALNTPSAVLYPTVLLLCVLGSYSIRNSMFDVGIFFAFGCLGYVMRKIDVPIAPLVLGMILGPLIESNLRRALVISGGSVYPFIARPISGVFLFLALVMILLPYISSYVGHRPRRTDGGARGPHSTAERE